MPETAKQCLCIGGAVQWDIQAMETVDSTMDEAQRRARDGAPEGTVVVAASMQDGRGTHGRPWHAPEGGLYLSFILRDPVDVRLLTLAIGDAVADVLEVAGAEPGMKWVNDVLVDGKKIAGVLVEAESTGSDLDFLVGGIGINVNGHATDWPHPLNNGAITLEDVLGVDQCIPDLQTFLLESLETWIHRLRSGDEHAVIETWRSRDALQGQRVGFDPDGDLCAKLVGDVQGIDDEGRILLDVEGEVQAHRSGSVLLM